MLENEKILLTRLKDNDQKAFDVLFHSFYPRVYNLARRFLHSGEDAEDVVQQTFIVLWENRSKIENDKPLEAYLLSISRHIIYNLLKRMVYKQRFIDFSLEHKCADVNFAEEYLFYNELKQIFERAVSEMPPRRKEIFNLSRNEGLSYKEIAHKLSVQESTVNTQISKAIEYLKEKLMDYRLRLWIF